MPENSETTSAPGIPILPLKPKTVIKKLERLYRRVPKIDCKGLCQRACGPIEPAAIELKRIEKVTGRAPFVPGFSTEGVHSSGELLLVASDHMRRHSMVCSKLDEDGKCTCYAIRPMICRLWGVVESMKCPHGCRPARYLTAQEADRLLRKVLELSMFQIREDRDGMA